MTIETQVTEIENMVGRILSDALPAMTTKIIAAVNAKPVDANVAAFNAKLDEISGDEKTILAQLVESVAAPAAEPTPATPVEEPAPDAPTVE